MEPTDTVTKVLGLQPTRLTGEVEESALHGARDGLEFDNVHGLADVHRAGHAPQGAPHVLSHLLNGEHLEQLVEYIRETV